MEIRKGLRVTVFPCKYESFETFTEKAIEVPNGTTGELQTQVTAALFEDIKNEVIRDACSVLDTLGLPPYENMLRTIRETKLNSQKIQEVLVDNRDPNAEAQKAFGNQVVGSPLTQPQYAQPLTPIQPQADSALTILPQTHGLSEVTQRNITNIV